MLCFRRTCPFGLPDNADATDNVVIASIGHALKVATAGTAEAPLPATIAALLAELERDERRAQARRRTVPRRPRATRVAVVEPRPGAAAEAPAAL
jgi:hypothetical protein